MNDYSMINNYLIDSAVVNQLFIKIINCKKTFELIKKHINNAKIENRSVTVFSFDNLIILINKTHDKKNTADLIYGFPFQLDKYRTNWNFSDYKVIIHINDPKIRVEQFRLFMSKIQCDNNKVKCFYISEEEFKIKASRFIKKKWDKHLYIDPYRFIGDSFIGLRCSDAIRNHFNKNIYNLSYNTDISKCHIFTPEDPIKYIKQENKTLFIVQPDYIDDQISNTYKLACTVMLHEEDVCLFILGRNIILHKHRQNIYFYKAKINDFILIKNVEGMIDNSLLLFGIEGYKKNNLPIYDDCQKEIFINGYTSKKSKDISYELFEKFYSNDYNYTIAVNTKSSFKNKNNIKYVEFSSINELYLAIEKNNIVITADTATAHIANRLNKMCFVLYKSDSWDKFSYQSLVHHSPFGFSSENNNFIPIIDLLNINDLIKIILYFHHSFVKNIHPLIVKSANKYINAVDRDKNKLMDCEEIKKKFINSFKENLYSIDLLNKVYGNYYNNNYHNWNLHDRILIEKNSPTYKLAKIITLKNL